MHRSIIVAIAALALAACGQVSTVEEPAGIETPANLAPGAEFCEEVERAVTPEECAILNELARRVQPGWGSFKAPESMTRGGTELVVLAVSRAPYVPPPPPEIVEEEPAVAEPEPPAPTPPPASSPAPGASEGEPEVVLDDAVVSDGRGSGPAVEQDETEIAVGDEEDDEIEGEVPSPPTQTPRDMVETVPGVLSEFEPMTGRFMRANLNADQGFEITALSPAAQEVTEGGVTTWRWRVRATEDGARQLELETVVEGCLDDARTRCFLLESTRYQHPVTVSVGWWGKLLDWLKELPDILKIITAALVALTGLVAAIFGLRAAFRKGRNNNAVDPTDAEIPT
jgi:hypothetical protein